MPDATDCLEFVRKGPTDPGGIMFCRRCGLHGDIHAGPGETERV